MKNKRDVEVSPHKDGWQVQKEAIKVARQQAKNEGSELIIKGQNHKIRQKDTEGNKDPRKSKG